MHGAFDNEQTWLDAGTMRRDQPVASLFGPVTLPPDGPERRFSADWIDSQREATHSADPAYPQGVAIDVALAAQRACRIELPYPAARSGVWVVVCKACGYAIALGTAGLADDPRSVRVPCRLR